MGVDSVGILTSITILVKTNLISSPLGPAFQPDVKGPLNGRTACGL